MGHALRDAFPERPEMRVAHEKGTDLSVHSPECLLSVAASTNTASAPPMRLTAVLDGDLLSDELADVARYYRAKADKDLGRTTASLEGMQQVAAAGGRLAPQAQRGIANLARIAA